MDSKTIMDLTGQYILNTYGRFPVAIDHGQGARLYSPEGREYIDLPAASASPAWLRQRGLDSGHLRPGCQAGPRLQPLFIPSPPPGWPRSSVSAPA